MVKNSSHRCGPGSGTSRYKKMRRFMHVYPPKPGGAGSRSVQVWSSSFSQYPLEFFWFVFSISPGDPRETPNKLINREATEAPDRYVPRMNNCNGALPHSAHHIPRRNYTVRRARNQARLGGVRRGNRRALHPSREKKRRQPCLNATEHSWAQNDLCKEPRNPLGANKSPTTMQKTQLQW